MDDATSALISTMQAFEYEADQSMHVVDIMNEIGNNYAVSSDGIATALQESASALAAANNDYAQAVAMIAAANKTTQDVSKVGGALRTISLRLRGTEVEGEDNDGLITSKSKLQGKIKGLTGVDILTDTGAYRSTYEVLLDISKVFNKMNDMDQAALLEIIAGKNRSNVAAGLLSNQKDLEAAYKSAQDAEGSALRENEKYMDSIQGKIDQFNNSLQTMWNNAMDSDLVKTFVDIGRVLVELINKFGLLKSVIFALLTYLNVSKQSSLDFATWFFGKGDANGFLKMIGKIKNALGGLSKTQLPSTQSKDDKPINSVDTSDIDAQIKAKKEEISRIQNSNDYQGSVTAQQIYDARRQSNDNVSTGFYEDDLYAERLIRNKLMLEGRVEEKQAEVDSAKFFRDIDPVDQRDYWNGVVNQRTKELEDYQAELAKTNKQIEEFDSQGSKKHKSTRLEDAEKELAALKRQREEMLSVKTDTPDDVLPDDMEGLQKRRIELLDQQKTKTDALNAANHEFIKATREGADDNALNAYGNSVQQANAALKETNAQLSAVDAKIDAINAQPLQISQSMLGAQSKFAKMKLTMPNMPEAELAGVMDTINAKTTEGQVALLNYFNTFGEGNEAIQAYIASLNGGKASLTGFQAFMQQHNAGLKKSGIVAKAAAVGQQLFNAAISMGISFLIQFIISGIQALVGILDDLHVSAEEAAENLEETKNKISELESELDSLNTQLDEARDKMAELTALPSLSLTQQEDLDRLEREVELLERELALKERQLAIENAKLVEDAKTSINNNWYGSGAYDLTNDGRVQKDKWYTWGESGEDVINSAIFRYEQNAKTIEALKTIDLTTWDNLSMDEREAIQNNLIDQYGQYGLVGYGNNAEYIQNKIDELEATNINIASSITDFFNDPQYAGLTYGMHPDIDAFLDDFHNAQLRWEKALYGDSSKANAIESMFGPNATEEMKALKSEIDKIMATDDDWATKNAKIKALIPTQEGIDGYQQLDWAMKKLGVTAQDVADYFTVLNGEFNSSTPEGLAMQYQKGIEVLEKMRSSTNFEQDWGEFFTKDDEGKFEARADKFAEVLEGMDNETREIFMNIVESAVNGAEDLSKIDWSQAISKFTMAGLDSQFKLLDDQFESLNNDMFKGAADDIKGLIDTVSELKAALEDVAGTMDLVHTAQQQMSSSGRISVKTALELMESTEDWDQILTITNGTIKLADGAEQHLIQTKLTAIKTQLQYAWQTAQTKYEVAAASQTELDYAGNSTVVMTAESIKAEAIGRVSAVVVSLGAAMDKIIAGEWSSVWGAFSSTYQSATATVVADSNKYTTTIAELKKDADNKKKMLDAFENVDTISEFKNNYDYDKTPGDKYKDDGDDNGDDKRLENLQKKYEGKIKNLENQKTWLENEIAREEEIGAGRSKAYYEEQINLNNKLIAEYEAQRAELIALQNAYPEGSEKWYEVANAIWEMDHAIQEVATDSIKANKSIIDLYDDAFTKIGEAFSDKNNISEKRIGSMENYAELLDLRGDTATKGLFDAMDAEYDSQLQTKWEQFNAQQDIYNDLVAKRDSYTPDSDEWIYYNQQVVKAHAGLMDVKEEIAGIEVEQLQKREEFKELATQRWDDVQAAYANRDQYYQNQIDLNDKYIEKLETLGINVPDEAYEAQIDSLESASASKWEQYLQARQEMIDYEGIYGADSQEYIDKYNETIQLHHEYLDYENQILEKQQQIFDNQIDRFNQVIDRINNTTQRMQNISSLLEDEDVATEDGEWTAEGMTRLGMAYQQMEYYKQSADEVAKKIAEVEEQYKRGEISEKKYYETMQELEGQQWDMINSYEDMKDTIVDMNEARIDMIEEGLNKEAEAYQELIDLKKEELDAERD